MAITTEQEKQKVTFPEIRDFPEGGTAQAAVQGAAVEDDFAEESVMEDAAQYMQDESADQDSAQEADDSFSIDVDIDNMVWEVESASETEASQQDNMTEIEEETETEEYYNPYNRGFFGRKSLRYSRKMNKHLFTWLFSVGLGMYGLDRFARGQVALGVLKLLTFGGFGIWYLADAAIAIYKSYVSENSMYEDLYFDRLGRYIL